jgi:hypothetical protein
MNITSCQYQANKETNDNISVIATIDEQTISVPLDPANRHYAEILRQVDAGTLTIADAD